MQMRVTAGSAGRRGGAARQNVLGRASRFTSACYTLASPGLRFLLRRLIQGSRQGARWPGGPFLSPDTKNWIADVRKETLYDSINAEQFSNVCRWQPLSDAKMLGASSLVFSIGSIIRNEGDLRDYSVF